MRALAGAVGFLTLLPLPARWGFSPVGASAALFPLVGLGLGLALGGADHLAGRLFPDPLRAALTLALWLLLTGALHFDGWADLCDALMPGLSGEQARAALKDPRLGAGGLAGGGALLLVKFAALAVLPPPRWAAVAAAVLLARWAAALLIYALPYAGGEGGQGWGIKRSLVPWHLAAATVLALPALVLLEPALGVAGLLLAAGLSLALGHIANRTLGGVTGDVYGAAIEASEVGLLLLVVAWSRWGG